MMTHRTGSFAINLVIIIILAAGACGRFRDRNEPGVTPVPTWTPTSRPEPAIMVPTFTPSPAPLSVDPTLVDTPVVQPNIVDNPVLPAPLYFIDSTSGQIMRIERDGITHTTITQEQEPVLDFDVSPSDGHPVYVSGNDLIECDVLGNARRVILEGPAAPVIDLRAGIARYGPTVTVDAPRFSPDGQQLAFGLGGVQLMAASGATDPVTILASDPYTSTSNAVNNGNSFLPYAWSPDGARLLVEVRNYWEGLAWGIVEQPGRGKGYLLLPACCDPVWSPQGDAVYLSNIQVALRPPSLHRWLVATGELIPLLDQVGVAFPHVQQDGTLLAFALSGSQAPRGGFDLLMLHRVELTGDKAQLVRLRVDAYGVWTALWAKDDSGALIVERNEYTADTLGIGPFFWLPTDGSPAVPLRAFGSHPRWG